MDFDLLPDNWQEGQAGLSGNLLSYLPDGRQTNDSYGDFSLQIPDPNSSSATSGPGAANQTAAVISKIEEIFENIADCILGEKNELVIPLKSRGRQRTRAPGVATGTIENPPPPEIRTVKFPSRSPQEAWKFTAVLRILELSHEALVTGVVTTKRDMYYRDVQLFMKQAVVDRYVDDIAYTMGVQRDALNVVAAAKGLVAGSFILTRTDESIVDYTTEPEGLLIPNTKDIRSIQLLGVRWILVVEKEATFRTLATSHYWKNAPAGGGIIVTGKGYPDIQSRQFLHLISNQHPSIPILALVDFDPDGLGIMSTYKYGSMALVHENQNLTVPSIQWLGVRSCDMAQSENDDAGLLRLTGRDRRIAMRMLEKETFDEGGEEQEWRREVQVMLMLNFKAETQILSSGKGLGAWLDMKLLQACK